jgi:hypothetical protein
MAGKSITDFYWRWVRAAFSGALDRTALVAFIVLSCIEVVKKQNPQMGAVMASWVWAVPFWALLAVITARLVWAPYVIWRQDRATIEELRTSAAEKQSQVALREKLGEFLGEARGLYKRATTLGDGQPEPEEIETWLGGVQDYVRANLGQSYVQQLANGGGIVTYASPGYSPFASALHVINVRLGELLDKFS